MPPFPRLPRAALLLLAVLASASAWALTAEAAKPPAALKLNNVPQNPSNDPQPTVGWSQNFVAKKVTCTLDGRILTPCKSQHKLLTLDTGRHTFTVTAIAPSGKTLRASASWLTDLIAPSAPTVSGPTAWRNTAATFTASGSTDTGGSNLAGYQHRASAGAAWSSPAAGATFTVSTGGQTSVEFRSIDRAGNTSAWVEQTAMIDQTAPAVTVNGGGPAWTTSPVTLTATATDGGSGVVSIDTETSTDNGTTWSAPQSEDTVTVTANGATLVRFRASDTAGNTSGWVAGSAHIDLAAPIVAIGGVANAWSNTTEVATATASDAGSGVASVDYETSADGGTTWSAAQAGTRVTVTAQGTTLVRFRGTDNVGNVSDWNQAAVRIDLVAPSVSIDGASSGWSNTAETLTADASDATSGVAAVQYETSNDRGTSWSAPQTGDSVTIALNAVIPVRFRATDNAGNTSAWVGATASVDTVAPTLTVPAAVNGCWLANGTLTAQTSDRTSGVASVEYETSADGGDTWSDPQPGGSVTATDGATSVRFRATDNAGNTSDWTAVMLDTTAPTVVVSGSRTAFTMSTDDLWADATDAGSGVASAEYETSTDEGATWSAPVPMYMVDVSTSGVVLVRFRATDSLGNTSDWVIGTSMVDDVAPTLSVSGGVAGWADGPVTLTATTFDADSGVRALYYETSTDGGATWGPGLGALDVVMNPDGSESLSMTVTAEGTTVVRFRSNDEAGNSADWIPTTVQIDSIPPTVSIGGVVSGWSTAPETLTATASDAGPGIASVEYETSTDGGTTWSNAQTGDSVTATDGITLVRFRATDNDGLTSAWTQATARVDDTPPTLDPSGGSAAWATGPVTINAGEADAISGIGTVQYETSTDGGAAWSAPTLNDTVTIPVNGTTLARFRALDNAGNQSAWTTPTAASTATIDTLAPTLAPTGGDGLNWTDGPLTITAGEFDAGAGVASVQYKTSPDGGLHWSAPQPGDSVTVTAAGTTVVLFQATDKLGHTSDWTSNNLAATARIDLTAPTLSPSGTWNAFQTAAVTLQANAADDLSGIAQVVYETSPDGGTTWSAPQTGTSVTFDPADTTLARFRATDGAGNVSGWAQVAPQPDTTPPTLNPSGGGWTNGTKTISAGADDAGSGVASVQYETSTDGGTTWSDPQDGDSVDVSAVGITEVRFQATDALGNTSAWTTPDAASTAGIDRTAPTLAPSGGSDQYQAPPVTITAGATDDASGVAQVVYETSTDGGTTWSDPQPGSSVTFTGAGTTEVRFQATDVAGNVSDWTTADANSTPHVQPPLDIELVVDRTGSMAEDTKMANLQNGLLKGFLPSLTPSIDSVGLTVFPPDVSGATDVCKVASSGNYDSSKQTYAVVPLSNDYQSSAGVLNANSTLVKDVTCLQPGGGTSYTGALEAANAQLQSGGRPGVQKVIIILTDGAANDGRNCADVVTTTGSGKTLKTITTKDQDPDCLTPCHAAINDAASYKASGTIVYSILYGDQSDAPYCLDYSGADREQPLITPQSTLMQIASSGGYFADPDPTQLPAVFQSIFTSLPS